MIFIPFFILCFILYVFSNEYEILLQSFVRYSKKNNFLSQTRIGVGNRTNVRPCEKAWGKTRPEKSVGNVVCSMEMNTFLHKLNKNLECVIRGLSP